MVDQSRQWGTAQTNLNYSAWLFRGLAYTAWFFQSLIPACGLWNALLVPGFGGVGNSALAAAAIGRNYKRLGRSWEVLIRVETLLAAPGLVFCLFNAQNIVAVLYPKTFAPVGTLLAIFLFFNLIVRVLGTTIHQSTLYVMNKARLVVMGQWIGLGVVIVLGIFLIPRYGPAEL